MKYTINYNTGAGNETVETNDMMSLRALADEGATYTQQPITIEGKFDDGSTNIICTRQWVGCLNGIENCEDPIRFGDYGYYSDWQGDDWLD
jgi:hypothetical protein